MSFETLERLIRRTANRFGIDIHRYRPGESLHGRLSAMLEHYGVDLLFDVGANVGQFAHSIRRAGFQGKLVSFEPLSSAHAELLRMSRHDSGWEVAPRIAIGAHEGEVEIKISRNSFSSSVLSMLPAHLNAAPESVYTGTERVRLSQLDTAARDYVQTRQVPFVKIDTQGYEDRVLDGATEILDRAVGLHLELSFVPLYEGQALFDEMVERLLGAGFRLWGIWPGIHDPDSGRMLQVDATFFAS